ncbi:hypothetical protein RvY_01944 [Ramazzottius varieornatus]|uniref:Uncharacterized protein n=1 Tax=Ramazzottius varieornatus TaxID=947166 RepID=A0A1D1UI49_RAMVA|nr:hypothetical protein RvY_01944 [Ramazzottius varieornatus]
MSSTRSPYELLVLAFRNRVTRVARSTTPAVFSARTPLTTMTTPITTTTTTTATTTATPPGADNPSSVVTFDPVGVIDTTFSPITSTVMSTTTPVDERGLAPWTWMALGGLLTVLLSGLALQKAEEAEPPEARRGRKQISSDHYNLSTADPQQPLVSRNILSPRSRLHAPAFLHHLSFSFVKSIK